MKVITRTALLLMMLSAGAQVAYSCSCRQISEQEEFRKTAAVFVGKVVEVAEDKGYVPPGISPKKTKVILLKRYIVKFAVERGLKGVEGEEISVFSFQNQGSCHGVSFAGGGRYLVYANPFEGGLVAGGLCTRTRELDEDSEEYRRLISGSAVLNSSSNAPPNNSMQRTRS